MRQGCSECPLVAGRSSDGSLRAEETLCQEEELETGRRDSLADVLPQIELKEVH